MPNLGGWEAFQLRYICLTTCLMNVEDLFNPDSIIPFDCLSIVVLVLKSDPLQFTHIEALMTSKVRV
jgi:hypothetical protein